MATTTEEQSLFSASISFAAGTQTRHIIWASSDTITLNSTDVPGTAAGTVTIPALRVSWEGGLWLILSVNYVIIQRRRFEYGLGK